MGVWGFIAPPGQFRAGFSEQFIIIASLGGQFGDNSVSCSPNAVGLAGESPAVGIDCLST